MPIGCGRARNDLDCVVWGARLYSLTHLLTHAVVSCGCGERVVVRVAVEIVRMEQASKVSRHVAVAAAEDTDRHVLLQLNSGLRQAAKFCLVSGPVRLREVAQCQRQSLPSAPTADGAPFIRSSCLPVRYLLRP